MRFSSFLPRTKSKVVFVIVMASYSLFAASLLGAVMNALGAQRAQPGILLQRGYPTLEAVSSLILAPLIESLILIAMIELLRWLRSPAWLQIGLPALISAAQHVPVSVAVAVAPSWLIMAAAYVMWRRVSRKVAFAIIASIHALFNLNAVIWTVRYAIDHRHA